MNCSGIKLRPELDGEFWMIGDNPELGALQGKRKYDSVPPGGHRQQCVDHHIFQTDDGYWHLWGCIRGTAVGRIFYHWESKNLTDIHWERTGEIIRTDVNAGECIDEMHDEEFLQSPYIIKDNGLFYMFYGAHSTGLYKKDMPDAIPGIKIMECQMCMMTSNDGRHWTRFKNSEGYSRIFISPGEVRDPCLIKIGDLWHLYYTGHELINKEILPGIFVRTSNDLINWSKYILVHRDRSPRFGKNYWDTECPHVVERNGYYYLFRTENYPSAKTHVFRSKNPYDFGIGSAEDKYIGMINIAAPEIIVDQDGQEYITSNHDLDGGTQMCRLKWVDDQQD